MKKIVILIQNNTLFFTYRKSGMIREDLMNTNIISDSELVFTDDYIQENKKLVIPFLEELCDMNCIDSLTIQNNELAIFIVELFSKIKIKTVKIKKQENLTYTLCEHLLKMKYLTNVDCYSIPEFMLELLDNHHITVTTHSEIFYISSFMSQNKLTDYTKIYYQKEIKVYNDLTEEDQEDFIAFLKINKYLQIVCLLNFNKKDIEFILENLKRYHFKNIYLELHANISHEEDYLYLKQLNKKYKKAHLEIGLYYSSEYLKDNIMKQIIINTLKLCAIMITCFIVGIIGYISVDNYLAMQEVTAIQENVKETMEKADEMDLSDIENDDEEELVIKNKYIAALLSINKDVVGYLKVNNTNVDYPVVIGEDNKYYLNKNLYGEDDKNGWVFMDFRNSDKYLNDNTIIYGHNMYYSGVMFGTLHRVLNASWYNNEENLTIQFDTMYESMTWQIYSIYTIPKTSDYLKVTFKTPEEKMQYIDMTKNRSIKDFGIEVTANDKLLTLSTCTGSNDRLVIHAKLNANTATQDPNLSDNELLSD